MGEVWVARHKGLETDVVVKFLAATGPDRADAEARFAREAAAAAAVKSPHVVQVFDHGVTPDGTRYIVMELLEGRDLARHLAANGPMAPRDVAAVIAQTAKALSKAHQAGVIHRDVKPENVFLCDGDGGEMFVKVLDFGIAKREEATTSKTSTGQVVGTPFYMSPEQLLGERPVDLRTDVWSLGVVAFEALTGKRPFDGATVGSITLAIHQSAPRPSTFEPSLPAALDDWFARACARKPEDRFATAREAGQAILTAVGDPTTTSGAFRAPLMSISEPSLMAYGREAENQERAVTTLSSSFAAEPLPKRRPPALLVAGGILLVAVLGAFVVVAARRGPAPTSAAHEAPSASLGIASAVTTTASNEAPPAVASSPEATPTESAHPPAPSATAPKPRALAGKGATVSTGTRGTRKPVRKPNDDDIK